MDEVLEPTRPVVFPADHDRQVCRDKIQHKTKADARIHRNRLRREGSKASIYECTFCHLFHVTSSPVEHDRTRRRAARDGDLVSIHYDANEGDELAVGDGLVTSTGRTYRIVGFDRQTRGRRAGRYHLLCAVNQPIAGRSFPLVWYKR